jgi:hypothetical protein
MRLYECLIDDPAVATAVYVPYYPGLELQQHLCDQNFTVHSGPSSEFIWWLSSLPQWVAFGGRDHFMVAAMTNWMFRQNETVTCGNDFLDHPESGSMTVLAYESNAWESLEFAVPYLSYFHPTSAGEVATLQAWACATERPSLYTFVGARRANGMVPIRDHIIDSCASSSRCRHVDCSDGACKSPCRVISCFAASSFCLQPHVHE